MKRGAVLGWLRSRPRRWGFALPRDAPSVVIVLHEHEKRSRGVAYTVWLLRQEWVKRGFRVEVVYGIDRLVPADVAINHVNLTITPAEYDDFLLRYPVVINGRLRNISKHLYSPGILHPGDRHEGPVIVKTNANYGGIPEAWFAAKAARRATAAGARSQELAARIQYPIYASLDAVPADVWTDDSLIVQKFMAERDASGHYVLRCWSFLGDRGFHVLTSSPSPIVRGESIVRREVLRGDIPEALAKARRELGVDYGRMDYAVVDGEVVLYDVNRTPTTSARARVQYAARLKEMAGGLTCFLPAPRMPRPADGPEHRE